MSYLARGPVRSMGIDSKAKATGGRRTGAGRTMRAVEAAA